MRVRLPLFASLLLVAGPALAEQSDLNLHLDIGVGAVLPDGVFADGVALKLDTTLIKALGPVAPQLEMYGLGAGYYSSLADGSAFGFGIGARLRLFNDERGYYFLSSSKSHGTLWGNLYADAHFTWALNGIGPGCDASVGTELSLIDGLSVGPFVKYALQGVNARTQAPSSVLLAGLSFTLGMPQKVAPEGDDDGDGVLNKDDKCPTEAEDKDGFEDMDGCPDLDNDKDGILDAQDKCPLAAEDKDGFEDADGCPDLDDDKDGVPDAEDQCPRVAGTKENKGCPDDDKDKDGLLDRLDSCPDQAGPADNKGCPDGDKDKDGVVDRLDACVDVAGAPDNKGCPWPDGDADGVADRFDNCPREKGVPENQGCPANQKQLVVITKEKLLIKEKVFFDVGKATIQARSNPLVDQLAAVLAAHEEIALIQIEGHTDNTGSADTNRKLSADRAAAVKAALVKKKVAETRLRSVGFGPDHPAESNDTEKGREANRRVEFNIVSQ